MRSLQASTSYSVAVPSFHITPRHHIPRRHAISAKVEPSEKSVEIMRKFSEQYARKSGTYFCVDKGVTSVVIKDETLDEVKFRYNGTKAITEKLFVSVIDAGIQIETKNLREIVEGLAEHKDTLGAPLCPCRHYDDKSAEAGQGFWNCPCVPMRERKQCHCMLFLTPENDFAGREQAISMDEIKVKTSNM